MSGMNTTSQLPPLVQGYYDKRALIRAKNTLTAYELMQKKTLPEGNGTTVNFWRYAPLTKVSSALTQATDGGISLSGRQQLTNQEVTCTPSMWGDYISLGRLANMTSIDQGVSEKVDVVSQQAAESIDYYIMKAASQGMMRRRADNNSNYQVSGTATGGTTGTLVDSSRTASDASKPSIGDSYYVGGYITITGGPGYGQTRPITGYTNSSGTFTVSPAFTVAPTTSSTYRAVVGTSIDASGKLDSTSARLIVRDLAIAKAIKYEQGFYVGVLDPDVTYDFFGDDDFKKAATYKDSVDNLITNEIGKWAGIRWVHSTENFRETVAGVETEYTGAVHVVPVFGKEACGVVNIGSNKQGKKNFEIKIKTPDQLGQPLDFYSTVGWQAYFECVILNGCFGVNLLCGASDVL